MKKVQKNHMMVACVNIMIYANSMTELWKYRNMCSKLEKREDYHVNLTLTKDLSTVFRIIEFLEGGVDLFISAQKIEKPFFEILRRKVWDKEKQAHLIVGRKQKYMHYYRNDECYLLKTLDIKDNSEFLEHVQNIVLQIIDNNES